MTKSHKKAIKAISESGGRFFGVTLKGKSVMSARFLSMSECYVKVFDVNAEEVKKFSKNSIVEVRSQGVKFKVHAPRK